MSQAPAVAGAPQALNSLLLPLYGRTLLLPSTALAELINPQAVEPQPGAPGWYLGDIIWRDLRVPLLSFECASSGASPLAPQAGERVAVLNAIGGRPQLKFFALRLRGIPRPLRVESTLVSAGEPLAPLELDSALAEGETVRIPDLLALEQMLADIGRI